MKWKHLAFMLMVGVGATLASCSDDNKTGNTQEPGGETPQEEGYFSFRMSSVSKVIYSKAPATEAGDVEESVVTSGLMAFYDPTSLRVKEQFILDITNTDGQTDFTGGDVASSNATNSNETYFISKAQKLEKGDYKLLVVLNPTAAMTTATAKDKYYTDFEEAKTASVADFYGSLSGDKAKEIVMTNAAGLVNVTESMFKDDLETAEKASDKPLVQVDRILAKVSFKMESPVIYPAGGELKDATWQLDITNKLTYWIRRITFAAPVATGTTGDGVGGDPKTDVLTMENDAAFNTGLWRDYMYAEDPNFDGYSNDRIIDNSGVPTKTLSDYFNFLASGTTSTGFTKSLSTTATREYVLENTMAADEQWEDVTTRILVRGNFVPGTAGISDGDSYYFFGGKAFTHKQIADMFNDPVANPWPTNPTGLKEAAEAAVTANVGFDFSDPAIEPATSLADPAGAIHFYKDGINYYYILIRHFNDNLSSNDGFTDPEKMNFGRYGVVRNNVYNVTLERVNGPGTPTIPKPEGPDDKKKGYISARIEILPWVQRTQGVGIGD